MHLRSGFQASTRSILPRHQAISFQCPFREERQTGSIYVTSYTSVTLVKNVAVYNIIIARTSACAGGASTVTETGPFTSSGFFVLCTLMVISDSSARNNNANYKLMIRNSDGTFVDISTSFVAKLYTLTGTNLNIHARGTPTASNFIGTVSSWIVVNSGTIPVPSSANHITTADYAYLDYGKLISYSFLRRLLCGETLS